MEDTNKPFYSLEVRIDYLYPDGKLEQGLYYNSKNYKTYKGVLDAFNYRKKNPITGSASLRGKHIHESIWHFRPRHRYKKL